MYHTQEFLFVVVYEVYHFLGTRKNFIPKTNVSFLLRCCWNKFNAWGFKRELETLSLSLSCVTRMKNWKFCTQEISNFRSVFISIACFCLLFIPLEDLAETRRIVSHSSDFLLIEKNWQEDWQVLPIMLLLLTVLFSLPSFLYLSVDQNQIGIPCFLVSFISQATLVYLRWHWHDKKETILSVFCHSMSIAGDRLYSWDTTVTNTQLSFLMITLLMNVVYNPRNSLS
jgi:hypothetical protein